MLPFDIRPATESDAERIFDTHRNSVVKLCPASYSAEQIRCWLEGRSAAMYVKPIRQGDLWVADDGVLLGFAEVAGDELTKLFVRGDHSRAGVGTALLNRAIAEIAARGHSRVYLEATTNACPFYVRHGFTVIGYGHFSHGGSAVPLEITHMEKTGPFT
ncbi:GNAT family N-acetyltransferase [Burkholderia sp. Bp8992]|uniref:GNAT family N-acetyltransferase n=1 Tax=Burkholderia sp. Bp8992 TaxID=2184554 RepID=UPI000F57574E|nr:GNAT family N-acetyltransferase [Burkholderia sp. Bp8992]RQS26595.1 GNAT family N-acetyltransferase [Burkholderia sp. Bp8992]